jgi:hypothetical protein
MKSLSKLLLSATKKWRLETGDWKEETGKRKLGIWNLETGNWELGTGIWELETGNWNYQGRVKIHNIFKQNLNYLYPSVCLMV